MSYYTKSCAGMGIDGRYLSRTHWAQTIATPTGPRDQVFLSYQTDIGRAHNRYRFIYSYQIPNYPIDKLKKSWKKQLGTWLMNQEIIPLSVER